MSKPDQTKDPEINVPAAPPLLMPILAICVVAAFVAGLIYWQVQPEGPLNEERQTESAELDEEAPAETEQETAKSASPSDKASLPIDPTIGLRMTPHQAIYDIEMTAASSNAQIINISGQMFFQWTPTCEAWTTEHKFNLIYEYADSPAMHISSDFSTYEPFDGSEFNFSSRRSRDGEIYEELRGRAEITDPETGSGVAFFTFPEDLSFDLPPGTIFPMRHTLDVTDALKNGGTFVNRTIFDGSDSDGPVNINAFIGREIDLPDGLSEQEGVDTGLLPLPARKVQMAFFPLINETAAADYEMIATLHTNGVISAMEIDYGDFSVRQNLVALEELERSETCN